MSDRDPRYNPIALLINAGATETRTGAEWSALCEFHEVAEQWKQEADKLDSILSFMESSSFANLQPNIKEFTQEQAKNSSVNATSLFAQLVKLSQSDILRPVIRKAYEKALEADMESCRIEKEDTFQKNSVQAESQRNQQVPVVQATSHTLKNATTPSHSTNSSPAIVRSPINKLLSVILVICIILLCISIFKNIDYTTQIAAHAQALEDAYDEGYDDGYTKGFHQARNQMMEDSKKPSPKSMPTSGTIVSGQKYSGSTLTIKSDSDSACVVSLKTAKGEERMAFFVRAGDTVTVNVPAEKLYAYFAYGTTWYGYGEGLMFGDKTSYSRDDEVLDFTRYTYEYTLYPTYNGNFTETPSDEDEFFG